MARVRRHRVSPRARAWIIGILVIVVGLVVSARAIAGFYTDYLWFDSVHHTDTWSTILVTKIGLAVAFVTAFFLLMWGNLVIADRIAPAGFRGPEDEMLARYREFVTPRQRLLRFIVSFVFALIAGVGASGQWNNWLLFRHGGSFGTTDPLHHRDIGFYIFKLPFVSYVLGWAFASVLVVLLVTTVIHYLNGGIRFQTTGQRVTPQVKAHLSVLLAVLALLKAADYWLAQYQLVLSQRGVVKGATYTDVHAQLPAIRLLLLISIFSAILLIVNIRQRGWALPAVAVGLWVLVALVAGAIYPWFIQTFQVARKESAREAPYIARNIAATRTALGLDGVKDNNFDYQPLPTEQAITDNESTVRNIRLLDPSVMAKTYASLETQLNFYQFTDMDVDRYPIGPNGSETQVVVAARELNPTQAPQQTWEGRHLIYTHGYGLALAPANTVTTKGRPDFLIGGVPISIDPSVASVMPIERPEIYFGNDPDLEPASDYAIVHTKRREESGQDNTTYVGNGGVLVNSFVRRAAFFLRFGDLQTLTSDFLTSKSRILYHRDVANRVHEVAPFLKLDHDPYPVVVDSHIKYVVDAYTTASSYPYAQNADTSQLDGSADLGDGDVNYIRNSVKAVVDAYDGTVDLYLTDTLYGHRDPIIRAYAAAFPKLFKPASELPKELRSHLRYPEDLFRVQTAMWGRYHITRPEEFYDQSDRWDVAQDPGTEVGTSNTNPNGTYPRIDPYYLLMKLPDAKQVSFLLFRPFVPHSENDSKKQLVSFMVAPSDPNDYGHLQTFTMTTLNPDGTRQRNRAVDGPLIVNSNILSDTNSQVSQTISLLEGGGSKVDFGNLLIVPIDKGLLYVRSIYVRANQEDSVSVLRKVVVAIGERVEVGDTLQDALKAVFPNASFSTAEPNAGPVDQGGGPTATPGTGTAPPGTTTTVPTGAGSPSALISQALTLFQQADDALKTGGADGLSTYQEKTQQAEDLVRQAQSQLSGAPGSTPTTTAPSR
jgi:uncharacterized membrane protein (UPF0182 family)